ncbi:MAG: hypothetical protein KHX42_09810, partial [Prevotella sp.]|nr:hypothetical protein [Prevotella sp.]
DGSSDFRDRNGAEPEYTYDGCGALTSDINGDIQTVEYDNGGMPRRIRFGSGNVTEYAYSATGQKLGVTHRTAIRDIVVSRDTLIMEEPVLQLDEVIPARTDGAGMTPRGTRDHGQVSPGRIMLEENTEYAGDFILKDGMPYMLLFDGGCCLYERTAATGSTLEFFYTKDHLGSNRTVVSEAGEQAQVTHYYPFGGGSVRRRGDERGADFKRFTLYSHKRHYCLHYDFTQPPMAAFFGSVRLRGGKYATELCAVIICCKRAAYGLRKNKCAAKEGITTCKTRHFAF